MFNINIITVFVCVCMYIGQKLIIIPLVVVSVGHAVYGLLVPWGYTPVDMATVGK